MTDQLTLDRFFERGRRLGQGRRVRCFGRDGRRSELSYERFTGQVAALARALCARGLRPGGRVATLAANHSRHLQLMWAAPLAGGVFHAINPRLPAEEIGYILDHAGDRMLFVDPERVGTVRAVRDRLAAAPECWVFSGDGSSGFEPFDPLVDPAGGAPHSLPRRVGDETDPAVLCYTSGTTGRPKAVGYSHRALCLHVLMEAMADGYGIRRADHVLLLVPFCHGAAWGVPYSALMCGADISILEGSVQPERILEIVTGYGVTFTAAVPEVFAGVAECLRAGPPPDLGGLRILMGGAVVPPGTLAALQKSGAACMHCWGMTETLSAATLHHLPSGIGSAEIHQGHPLPLTELALAGADGAPGRAGELLVRGPCVIEGYDGAPESARTGGWLPTGDVATVGPDGALRVQDRKKDLIRSGGEWISPASLERVIAAVPGVRECAVVGVPHARWGERPLCVLCADAPVEAETIREALRESGRFAKWQLPDGFVTLPELPRTPLRKLDRHRLRQDFRDHFRNPDE